MHLTQKSLKLSSSGLCLLAAIFANHAKAQSQYFTTSITTGDTYSWDAANWSVSGGTSSGPFASTWTAGDFARFYGGAGDTYTVTVNATESMSGLYDDVATANTLNINDAGGGTGSLSLTPDTAQASQNGFSWLTQGFLTGGSVVNINAPITGTGGVEEESGGGHLALLGNNSYTGGTLFTSSSTFVDYNNNNSFGAVASQIGYDGTTFSIMNNIGPSTVNIPNAVQVIGTTGVNFIGNSATMSGTWALGANTVNIRNNGVGTTETLAGVMSGTGANPVTFSGLNGGTVLLTAMNTYTGPTVVGSSGDTSITLALGVANAIADSTGLTLAGGTLNARGFNQAVAGALGLTASSPLYFGGVNTISFTGATATWTGTLNLADWSSADTLQVGTSQVLTSAQLADIEFDGNAATLGTAVQLANGDIAQVPEPSTLLLGLAGGLGVLRTIRRRMA